VILLYHKVYAEAKTEWWVEADTFYRQIAALRTKRVVYLDDYDPADPDQAVITFDGVYQNVLEYAAPLLADLGYPFELFVTSDYIGRDNAFDAPEPRAMFADAAQLAELVRLGGRLQWHTRTHRNLRDVTDRDIIRFELSIPDALRALDPRGFRWFAYAHGDFNEVVVEEARGRFVGALSCIQGNDADRYRLNRLIVTNDTVIPWPATVAVIVPSYNYGGFLAEAVESVMRQTRVPDEILIMDDASVDSTEQIGRTLAQAHPGIVRYHRNPNNLGIVDNFNLAVSLTSSDYVCFLGADNRFRADYVEKAAAALDNHPEAAVAYTDFALFGPRAKLVHEQFSPEWRGATVWDTYHIVRFPDFAEEGVAGLERRNFIHGSSMYRRAAFDEVGGYLPREGGPEDHYLFARMARAGWTAVRCAEPLLEYRQHSRDQAQGRLESAAEARFFRSQHAALEHALREAREQLAALQQLLQERDAALTRADQQLEATQRHVEATQQQLEATQRHAEAVHTAFEEARQLAQSRSEELGRMLNSRSWRVTAPLRWAMGSIRRVGERTLRHNVALWRGQREIRRSPLFDAEYYLRSNPDVRDAGTDPARHYLLQGWKELRDPSAAFSTSQYLIDNPDVARARINPLLHHLRYGNREVRRSSRMSASADAGSRSFSAPDTARGEEGRTSASTPT
jgi:peptidoglycan/xylan/chitin deacetylase (PgdA/CDA1 family)